MFKESCAICAKTLGLNRIKIKDGYICPACYLKAGFGPGTRTPRYSAEDVRHAIQKKKEY